VTARASPGREPVTSADIVKSEYISRPLKDLEDPAMATFSAGFTGRPNRGDGKAHVPPGQYVTRDFPVLSAGPTPLVPLDAWRLELSGDHGLVRSWTWDEFRALDAEQVTVDLHCVTRWSKLATTWTGVPVEALLADVDVESEFVIASSYGGYTTNLPLEDLLDGKAWVAFEYDGRPIDPEHGGPARLLVPHLYLWKSAKWLRGLRLEARDAPGFWEQLGYHNYGDPWREQRHWGD
jgi:DMSO/TMAO reductase YedYZ molybdopterin-dependent catalytic subunit